VANHKSAEKRARQTIKKTLINKEKTSATKTAVKKVRLAIAAGNKKEAAQFMPTAQKQLDILSKTGIVKANTAARTVSRLSSQIAKLK